MLRTAVLYCLTGFGILWGLGQMACAPVHDDTGRPDRPRVPCLSGMEALYDRYEGTGWPNACRTDADCIISGCSQEVCAAESVITTCEAIPTPARDLGCRACACMQGVCRWVR